MATCHPSLLLLLLLSTLTTTDPTSISPTSPTPVAAPLPPPTPPPPQDGQQLNNIIDALIGAGDFNSWAGILSAAGPSTLPLSATLFIPSDNSLSHPSSSFSAFSALDPFIFLYHIVPQRLSFSDLRLMKPLSRLPTLLPTKSLLITNTSLSNFTIDDSLLSHPDLYTTASVAVHGVSAFLNYSAYGEQAISSLPEPVPSSSRPPPPPPPKQELNTAEGGFMIGRRSDAACLCSKFPVLLLAFCGVLAFKIYRFDCLGPHRL